MPFAHCVFEKILSRSDRVSLLYFERGQLMAYVLGPSRMEL